MINRLIFLVCNFIVNNPLILKIRYSKLKTCDYCYDFFNFSFENLEDLKKTLFSKKYLKKKYYDENSLGYHTFNWLHSAKKIGGAEIVTLCKQHIICWDNNYKSNSFVWESSFVAKRLINLIYNFDFYAITAKEIDKKIFKSMIIKHYYVLKLQMKIKKNKKDQPIEISKALVLFELIHKFNSKKILNLINLQLHSHINVHGMHKSINPCAQAEYINNLYEIKNMFLFFGIKNFKELEFQIINMSSVLKNLFHKDNTIALFNGSNNANYESLKKINSLNKDIKSKKLHNINNGLAIHEFNKLKIFLDITQPTSKLLSQNLHSGTLSFEMSYDNEKIITNCGSIEKRVGKKPEFLRFSAAHSTIILNNTNISELVEKKSYKRIPKNILFTNIENEKECLWEASHDGYKDNFKHIVKRKLTVFKKNTKIIGEDNIIAVQLNSKKILYNIRFHLTPICTCVITNNKKSVLIKTKLNHSWIFESESRLTLEDSIYINDGKRINKTKQIVISGYTSVPKKNEKWSITKIE